MNNVLALQALEIECIDVSVACTVCISIISSDAGVDDGADEV